MAAVGWLRCAEGEVLPLEVTPNLQKFVNGVINESVNANTLFASQESISTGRYRQRISGQPDKNYTTVRLPAETALGEPGDTTRPYLMGNGALLRTTTGVAPVDGIGQSDDTKTELFALSGGAGLLIRVSDSLTLAPSAALTYSHVENDYEFNNPYSQQNFSPADRELFNWNLEVFTYSPALKMYYQHDLGFGALHYNLGYTYLFNDSIASNSSAINISSSTGLATNRVDIQVPTGASVAGSPISVRPMFQWNNISGSAVAGLGLRDLFEVGGDVVAEVLEAGTWISTITAGASYVSGKDFEGYHVGFGATF